VVILGMVEVEHDPGVGSVAVSPGFPFCDALALPLGQRIVAGLPQMLDQRRLKDVAMDEIPITLPLFYLVHGVTG